MPMLYRSTTINIISIPIGFVFKNFSLSSKRIPEITIKVMIREYLGMAVPMKKKSKIIGTTTIKIIKYLTNFSLLSKLRCKEIFWLLCTSKLYQEFNPESAIIGLSLSFS